MLNYKNIIEYYRKDSKTESDFRDKIEPFFKFLAYLDTAGEMIANAIAISDSLPDEFGLKELKEQIKDTQAFLDEYSGESVTEDMAK